MAKGYHHVTRDIRSQIYAYKASGWSMQRMAKKLGVHVSTISREIERNSGKRGYIDSIKLTAKLWSAAAQRA
jgi:IS30 family transposase